MIARETSVWAEQIFPSGSQVVSRGDPARPHFYVFGPRRDGDAADYAARCETTRELRDWLNGGPAPAWLAGLVVHPTDAEEARDGTGRAILAWGPYVESEPGRGDWHCDPADEFVAERRWMIAQLVKGERP